MDASHLQALTASLGTAVSIGKALIGIRDGALVNEKVAAINDQLLQAQQALLAHNAAMFDLQSKHFEACEELRKLKEALSERGRYSLFELSPGHFAYRVNIGPQQGGATEPGSSEPPHYICQPCFDRGIKGVLQRAYVMGAKNGLYCPICKAQVFD